MYRLLMGMAQAGAYTATVKQRVERLASKYRFTADDLLALDETQANNSVSVPNDNLNNETPV